MLVEDMTVVYENDGPQDKFPNGELVPMVHYFQQILAGLLDDGATCTITVDQNRNRIRLLLEFDNKEDVSWLLGPKMRVVVAVLELLRFQRKYIHRRYLEIAVRNARGEVQVIQNKRVPGFENNPMIELFHFAQGCVDNVDRKNPKGLINVLLKASDIIEDGLCELGYYEEATA